MACMVMVYKEGYTHEVRGVRCDVKRIDVMEVDYYLNNGWVRDVQELMKTTLETDVTNFEPVSESVLDALSEASKIMGDAEMPSGSMAMTVDGPVDLNNLQEDDLRSMAKTVGIKQWWIKKPETLAAEIANLEVVNNGTTD